MIRVTDIHKRFGTLEVLKGVSLEVAAGEVVSIVGASGAGKTTLLQIMGTLSRPDAGRVEIDGRDVFALGDKALAPFVSAEPFLASYDLGGSAFLVLGCDGVWDVVSDAEACRIVAHALADGSDAAGAAARLRDCAYLNGSGDNISVVVCDLTADNLCEAVAAWAKKEAPPPRQPPCS